MVMVSASLMIIMISRDSGSTGLKITGFFLNGCPQVFKRGCGFTGIMMRPSGIFLKVKPQNGRSLYVCDCPPLTRAYYLR
jgi:hypothetical protein